MWDPGFLDSLDADALDRAKSHVEQVLTEEQLKSTEQTAKTKKLDILKQRFYDLSTQADRQSAGLEFEKVLNELFALFELEPRSPVNVTGEQIDGSFSLDSEIYLVEAKWCKEPIPEADLLVFRGKVSGKSQFTRGVFISVNHITKEAEDVITRGKQPNFFVINGHDVAMVLEGRIELSSLLRKKLRRLAEEGRVYVPANELIE